MILRALFFDNSEEFGKNGILGQPPRSAVTIHNVRKAKQLILIEFHYFPYNMLLHFLG